MTRTVLLRDRCLVGQKFRCDGGQAIWLTEKSRVEFYDRDGQLLTSVALAPVEDTALQKAA